MIDYALVHWIPSY